MAKGNCRHPGSNNRLPQSFAPCVSCKRARYRARVQDDSSCLCGKKWRTADYQVVCQVQAARRAHEGSMGGANGSSEAAPGSNGGKGPGKGKVGNRNTAPHKATDRETSQWAIDFLSVAMPAAPRVNHPFRASRAVCRRPGSPSHGWPQFTQRQRCSTQGRLATRSSQPTNASAKPPAPFIPKDFCLLY